MTDRQFVREYYPNATLVYDLRSPELHATIRTDWYSKPSDFIAGASGRIMAWKKAKKVVENIIAEMMFEDDLPEMSNEEYSKWYDQSRIVFGVRMGPKYPYVKSEHDIEQDLIKLLYQTAKRTTTPEGSVIMERIFKDEAQAIIKYYKSLNSAQFLQL